MLVLCIFNLQTGFLMSTVAKIDSSWKRLLPRAVALPLSSPLLFDFSEVAVDSRPLILLV